MMQCLKEVIANDGVRENATAHGRATAQTRLPPNGGIAAHLSGQAKHFQSVRRLSVGWHQSGGHTATTGSESAGYDPRNLGLRQP